MSPTFCLQMSQFIVQCLNPYRKPDCKVGRITTTEDFKHLARKVLPTLLICLCTSKMLSQEVWLMCQMLRLGAQEQEARFRGRKGEI